MNFCEKIEALHIHDKKIFHKIFLLQKLDIYIKWERNLALYQRRRKIMRNLSLSATKPGNVIKNAMSKEEYLQSLEIVELKGGEIVGQLKRDTPGIDGFYEGVPISLKKYTGSSPSGVLRYSSRAEGRASNAAYSDVELYIDAKGVSSEALLDFIPNGGLSQIPRQGTISSIYINASDGWIVIPGGK